EVLVYPLKAADFDERASTLALTRVGLARLVPLLDAVRRWDRELSHDEQLLLAIARALLLKPPWVIIDGLFGSLYDEALERVVQVFSLELKSSAVIHLGRSSQIGDPFFSRVVHLRKGPAKPITEPEEAGAPTVGAGRKLKTGTP